jgi:hypothetical protein
MRKSIRLARKGWLEHFGYSTNNPMPYVEVAAKIIATYPRLQYDGVSSPLDRREAGKFVEFCWRRSLDPVSGWYNHPHILLRDPLPMSAA